MKSACAISSSVACPIVQYFFHLFSETKRFAGNNKLLNTKCVFRFYLCLKNTCRSKRKWPRFYKKMYIGLHVKRPLFLSDFDETFIFSTDF